MTQTKISLHASHMALLDQYTKLGFKDRSDMVRSILDRYQQELQRERLIRSAEAYASMYDDDKGASEWVDAAVEDWPA